MPSTKLRAWAVRGVLQGKYRERFYVEDPDGSIALARKYRTEEEPILAPGAYSDEVIVQAIRGEVGNPIQGYELEKCALSPNQYHPRIWRGEFLAYDAVRHIRPLSFSMQAPTTLFERMRAIAQTIQPHPDNGSAYGHELRNLLILACTQVEASLKTILRENGYARADKSEKFTTADYVKLAEPMRLREWKVGMPLYLDWGSVQPFGSWDAAKATQSLAWYQAYNDTKHDAEDKLSVATLNNVISAVSAVFVLLIAQFGAANFGDRGPYRISDFWVADQPRWRPGELYPPLRGYDDVGIDTAVAVPIFG